MTPAANPVRAALEHFEAEAATSGIAVAMRTLVDGLNAERVNQPYEQWQKWCREAEPHSAFQVLLEDPYSRDARRKSAGYAGDARMLDYVYLRDPGRQQITERGRALFAISTGVPIADAVRHRCQSLADLIRDRLSSTSPLRVASIACGHARELDFLASGILDRVRFWGLDHDAATVAEGTRRFPGSNCRFEVGSVRALLQGSIRIPASDIVYAAGLFDYLDDRVGAVVLKRMCAAVRPGGSVIVANLTPANEEIAYMEAVMNWWMQYRNETALSQLVRLAGLDSDAHRVSAHSTCGGRVAWIEIERVLSRT